jgi:hypothetical protein
MPITADHTSALAPLLDRGRVYDPSILRAHCAIPKMGLVRYSSLVPYVHDDDEDHSAPPRVRLDPRSRLSDDDPDDWLVRLSFSRPFLKLHYTEYRSSGLLCSFAVIAAKESSLLWYRHKYIDDLEKSYGRRTLLFAPVSSCSTAPLTTKLVVVLLAICSQNENSCHSFLPCHGALLYHHNLR